MEVDIRIMDASLNHNTLCFKTKMHLLPSTINLRNRLSMLIHQSISFTRIKSSLNSTSNLLKTVKDATEGNWKDFNHHSQPIKSAMMMIICLQISMKSQHKIMIKLRIKSVQQFCKIKINLLMLNHLMMLLFILQKTSLKFHLLPHLHH